MLIRRIRFLSPGSVSSAAVEAFIAAAAPSFKITFRLLLHAVSRTAIHNRQFLLLHCGQQIILAVLNFVPLRRNSDADAQKILRAQRGRDRLDPLCPLAPNSAAYESARCPAENPVRPESQSGPTPASRSFSSTNSAHRASRSGSCTSPAWPAERPRRQSPPAP
jgi:hypothetical protein